MSVEKALSVRQPWAHAIVHLGKDIENRDWNHAPSYRGPILIHAAVRPPAHELASGMGAIEEFTGLLNTPEQDDELIRAFKYGGVVGRARIVDVYYRSLSLHSFSVDDSRSCASCGYTKPTIAELAAGTDKPMPICARPRKWRVFSSFGFVLADVEPLPFYRCKGALGFFDVNMSLPPDPEPVKAPRVSVAKQGPQGRLF